MPVIYRRASDFNLHHPVGESPHVASLRCEIEQLQLVEQTPEVVRKLQKMRKALAVLEEADD